MYDVSQCNSFLPIKHCVLGWAPAFARAGGFAYLLMISGMLWLLSGCAAKAAELPPVQMPATLPLALTNALPTLTVPPQDAAPLLSLTQTVTVPVTVTAAEPIGAATADAPSTPLPSQGTITYTVKPGDNLSRIARTYGTTVETIKALNHLTSDVIYPGDLLSLPYTRASVPGPVTAATLTATLTITEMHTPFDKPATGLTSAEKQPSAWTRLTQLAKDRQLLVLAVAFPIIFLVAALGFLTLRRGGPTPVAARQSPAAPPAPPSRSGLPTPPAAGTAYLETSVAATGAPVYYPLTQPITSIGRDPGNSLIIDSRFASPDTVSRYHVQIVRTGDGFIAKDMGSANGLLINRRRSRENLLHDGAVLGIGKTEFVFRRNQPGGIA